MTIVSSENLRSLIDGTPEVQPFVYRERRRGDNTHPLGVPFLIVRVLDMILSRLTCCLLSVRNFVIH